MKGQVKVFNELLIFAIGLGLAVLVLQIFDTIENQSESIIAKDQLEEVSNLVTSAILQANLSEEYYSTNIEIPEKIANNQYRLELNGSDASQCSLVLQSQSGITTEQEIFNIPCNKLHMNTIDSTSRYLTVSSNSSGIFIEMM